MALARRGVSPAAVNDYQRRLMALRQNLASARRGGGLGIPRSTSATTTKDMDRPGVGFGNTLVGLGMLEQMGAFDDLFGPSAVERNIGATTDALAADPISPTVGGGPAPAGTIWEGGVPVAVEQGGPLEMVPGSEFMGGGGADVLMGSGGAASGAVAPSAAAAPVMPVTSAPLAPVGMDAAAVGAGAAEGLWAPAAGAGMAPAAAATPGLLNAGAGAGAAGAAGAAGTEAAATTLLGMNPALAIGLLGAGLVFSGVFD